mgnify:CR=1 FL=1
MNRVSSLAVIDKLRRPTERSMWLTQQIHGLTDAQQNALVLVMTSERIPKAHSLRVLIERGLVYRDGIRCCLHDGVEAAWHDWYEISQKLTVMPER